MCLEREGFFFSQKSLKQSLEFLGNFSGVIAILKKIEALKSVVYSVARV